jgi:hypothetical protein
MTKTYNLTNIRALLTQGFGPEDLRRLIYDTPDFRPVYNELAQNTGKAEIISKLMEYAEQNLKMDQLLALLQAHNPVRYEHHQPYSSEDSPASTPPDTSSTSSPPASSVPQPAQVRGKQVWFDQSHQQEKWDWGPIPTIEEFGYRAAKKYAEQAGYVVKALDRPVTSQDTLADCDLLIVVAPFHLHLQPAEIKVITRFVQNGKSLLLLSYYTGDSHHQNNLSQLGKEFGGKFKSDRVADALHHRHHKYEIIAEGGPQEEELLQGVGRLCFKQTCSLQVSEPARVVLRSSPDSFTEEAEVTDTGQILSWTATTNSQTPLVAVTPYGAGRFAAVGTWTVFLSEYLESVELDNRQFYLNLLHWLTASTPPPSVPTTTVQL